MINNVVLMGRLVATPELKITASSISVTSFTIAVDRNYSKGEERQTDFINCVAWRNTADFISKYFQKGSMIAVTGSIQIRKYEDKNGNKRTAVEILVNQASFCGSKKEANNTVNAETSTDNYSSNADGETDDDLPF